MLQYVKISHLFLVPLRARKSRWAPHCHPARQEVSDRCRLDLIRVSPWPRIRAAVGRRPKPRASLTAVLSAQSSLRHWLSQ